MAIQIVEIPNHQNKVRLRVAHGHFATSHSHINYYIDLTMTKHRLSEARIAAEELCGMYKNSTIVDSILCLDGTEVLGACMASALSQAGFRSMNAHQTIYVVTPEHTSGSQLIFRDNIAPMIVGKHVLVLAASLTTGFTARSAIEAIRYYSGMPAGVSAIFSAIDECEGFPVKSVFTVKENIPDYVSCSSHNCPMCKAGEKLTGLVNSHGVSSF